MSKFVIKGISAINDNVQAIRQIIILPDSADAIEIQRNIDAEELNGREYDMQGVFDEYEVGMEAKYQGNLRGIMAIMQRVADGQSISQDKFKEITPAKKEIKEYEFKHQKLRVYAIKIRNGKLVIFCGYKNSQATDIKVFRGIKKKFFEVSNK